MKKEQKRKILFYGILAGALLLFAACAAHLAPYDPYEQNLELSLLPPSAAHWMGTDRYGRDLFSRILSGARVSIFSALLVVAASALIGTLAGIFSGWLEGKTDTVLMQISDIFLAFPGMVFAIAFSERHDGSRCVADPCFLAEICTACAEPCAGIETHAVHRGGAPYRKRNMEDDRTPYSAESCGADDCHSGA